MIDEVRKYMTILVFTFFNWWVAVMSFLDNHINVIIGLSTIITTIVTLAVTKRIYQSKRYDIRVKRSQAHQEELREKMALEEYYRTHPEMLDAAIEKGKQKTNDISENKKTNWFKKIINWLARIFKKKKS